MHGVLWVEDCPEVDENFPTDHQIEEFKQFFDSKCCAWNPDITGGGYHPSDKLFTDIPDKEKEMDLVYLINRVQRHTICGPHCLRKNNKTGKVSCRYKFPKELREESIVDDSEGYLNYKPLRNDEYFQRYNPVISAIWRANTDFTPIACMDAVLRYKQVIIVKHF